MSPGEAWWKAYHEYTVPYTIMIFEVVSRGLGHYLMWGHVPTDPFIKTCLLCGKEW